MVVTIETGATFLARFVFDFQFGEISYELWVLGVYRETLERQLNFLREQGRTQLEADLKTENWNDDEVMLLYHTFEEQFEEALPRFMRNSFALTL